MSRARGHKVGSNEHRAINRQVSDAWKSLSAEQKGAYRAKAAQIQQQRQQLQGQSLSGPSAAADAATGDCELSAAQIKRLTSGRLDKTLSQISGHSCWDSGLALADHIAALRSSLVKVPEDCAGMTAAREAHRKTFDHDPEILPNPKKSPTYMRPCATREAGTCVADAGYSATLALVSQFDTALQQVKLVGAPVLVQFNVQLQHDVDRVLAAEHWMVLAGVSRRPLCHSIIYAHEQSGQLRLTARAGSLHVGTLRQKLRSLVQACQLVGQQASDFLAKAEPITTKTQA